MAIFIGPHTPVPLGDYFAGPSHVLPTGGTAKFFGALSCNDFLKASSTLEYSPAGVAEDADSVVDFALREGLTAHAAAVRIRVRRYPITGFLPRRAPAGQTPATRRSTRTGPGHWLARLPVAACPRLRCGL